MIGPLGVIAAHAPGHLPENQHKKQEEDACNLKHEDAADAAKRAHKAAQPTAHLDRCLSCLASHIALSSRSAYTGNRHGPRSAGIVGGAGQALPGQPSGHAKSYSQHPANGLRSHPVYDGSSEGQSPLPGNPGIAPVALLPPPH